VRNSALGGILLGINMRTYFVINGLMIYPRQDTYSAWILANPILAFREVALELDTKKVKIGDGVNKYDGLPYSESIGEMFISCG